MSTGSSAATATPAAAAAAANATEAEAASLRSLRFRLADDYHWSEPVALQPGGPLSSGSRWLAVGPPDDYVLLRLQVVRVRVRVWLGSGLGLGLPPNSVHRVRGRLLEERAQG